MIQEAKICAVVVTHNRPEELKQVVMALQKQSHSPTWIVVLDNASPTPASDTLRDFQGVEIVRSEINTGGAGGFSSGIESALQRSADWIWLLDDDAIPELDALATLQQAISHAEQQSEQVGAICSSVYEFGALAPLHRRHFLPNWGLETRLPEAEYSRSLVQIDTGSFVGFLASARACREIGLPRSDFFIAYDDTEYSLRLLRAGFTNWLAPRSKINHLRTEGSRLRSSPFGVKHFFNIRNRIIVARNYSKHPVLATWLASLFGIAIWMFSRKDEFLHSLKLLIQALNDGRHERTTPPAMK